MIEPTAFRFAITGVLVAALATALIIHASIGLGIDAVARSLWRPVKTALVPATAPRAGPAAPRNPAGHQTTIEPGSSAALALSQAISLASAAPGPWQPLSVTGERPSAAGLPAVSAEIPSATGAADPAPVPRSKPTRAAPAAAPPTAGASVSPAEELLRRAEELTRLGQTDGALLAFADAVRTDPSLAKAHTGRGQALAKKGDIEGALSEFGEAIRRDPKNAEAFRLRALARAYRNDSDNAIIDWTSAIGLASEEPGRLSKIDLFMAWRSRAALYDTKQLFAREITDLTRMVDSYWKDPELAKALDRSWGNAPTMKFLASMYRLRGNTYARVGLAERAIEDLSFAIALDQDHAANAYNDRARIEQKLGRREDAVDDIRAALRLDPGMTEAKEALARIEAEPVKQPP